LVQLEGKWPVFPVIVALAALIWVTGAAGQQAPAKPPFHATHYEVDATLSPGHQTLTAKVQADFVANAPSSSLQVELNPNLKIDSIQLNGQPVQFSRVAGQALDVAITLPNAVTAGQDVRLSFAYSGPLANDQNSPSPGVQLAYIGKDSAYLLLAARWFPIVSYVGQRYTAVFHLTVPGNFAVVGSGTSGPPDTVSPPADINPVSPAQGNGQGMGFGEGEGEGQGHTQGPAPRQSQGQGDAQDQGQWLRYTFTSDQPGSAGTFVGGALELSPMSEGGIPISVYTSPAEKATASAYANQLSQIVAFYSSEFGPLPNHSFTIAQLPTVAPMEGVSAPGMILVNQRQWATQPDEKLLARLVAYQWWNDLVQPATPADVWLSDGLAQYSEVLYEEHEHGDAGLHQAVDDCAVGALMDNSAAPIAEAWQLQPYTTAYESVVQNKGAMVFHMLRSSIGQSAFLSLLHDYLQTYSGKTATLNDFEALTQSQIASQEPASADQASQTPPLNTRAFFSQWLNSTGIPDFHLDYTVYRTQKGFKVVGKIEQNLTTLNMPIQVRVETEGNPVTKAVQVVGDTSEFAIDTFGQPKPNGILLDPNNNVLKDTPDLRLRALIAHGVALAEQGQFFQAIQQYQKALDIQHQSGLALFRMGEAYFYEKNYQAAANSFRDCLDGVIPPSSKWIEVWSHIYLGKIYDLIGQRERALNEYQKALDTKDDTSGALEQAREYMKKPYGGQASSSPGT
jgi:aminopeptidase N